VLVLTRPPVPPFNCLLQEISAVSFDALNSSSAAAFGLPSSVAQPNNVVVVNHLFACLLNQSPSSRLHPLWRYSHRTSIFNSSVSQTTSCHHLHRSTGLWYTPDVGRPGTAAGITGTPVAVRSSGSINGILWLEP
jgi:hypothetical protein